jgi:hypothetical protein
VLGESDEGFIDPQAVGFSQASIGATFKDGGTIEEMASRLRDGTIDPHQVPPIRLFERDGRLYSLDNRRLWAFRTAGVAVPYRAATDEEVRQERWKFTTRD